MSEEQVDKRSRVKIAIVVVVLLVATLAVVAVILGGYTPFYREFLQAPKRAHFADHIKGIVGIDYVAKVNEGLYRGSYPKDHLDQLKKLGIKSIINFRYLDRHDYREEAEAAGFKYHRIALHPEEPPTRAEIEKFFKIIDDASLRPVYIHCTMGIDRTGVMSGIYRIERDGWVNAEAVAEMEYFGHNELWVDLEEFLKRYPLGIKDD